MVLIVFALAFASFVAAAFLTPDKASKAGFLGLALLTAALGLFR